MAPCAQITRHGLARASPETVTMVMAVLVCMEMAPADVRGRGGCPYRLTGVSVALALLWSTPSGMDSVNVVVLAVL